MMDKLFLQIINMSITSSYIILFIIAIRIILKKAPKIFSYVLWLIPFFRLIFPFSFESLFSFISINKNTIPEDIVYSQTPQIQSGISAIDSTVNRALPKLVVGTSVNSMQTWITIGTLIWLIGIIILLIYSIYSTLKLSKVLRSAISLYDNIYEIETIKTPFVFGLIRPKIYLPNNLSDTEKSYIIKHEQTHIKRFDSIIKFVAFFIVSIHWFNPLVWVAYYLMGEDMELSCDESVIKEMGYEVKKDYSSSLLSLSSGEKIIGGSPVAFGENNIKGRIKNILNYKKPKLGVILISLIIILILALGLLSNQPSNQIRKSNDYEERAAEFINLYYAQYEKRDKIEELFIFDEDALLLELENDPSSDGFYDGLDKDEIEGFVEENFGDILTEDEKLRLINNRVIPNAYIINTKIVKATVSSIEFDKLDSQNDQSSFNALIIYEPRDGEPIEVEESGVIRLVEDSGDLKVDYFEISSE